MKQRFFRCPWSAYAALSALGHNIRDLRAMLDVGTVIIGPPPFPAALTAGGEWINSTLN